MIRLWSARGYAWGFRFLRQNVAGDPLPLYEDAFVHMQSNEGRLRRFGGGLAIRFVDPDGRKDRSGRPIVHDLILDDAVFARTASYDEVRDAVWKEIREEYETLWDGPHGTE